MAKDLALQRHNVDDSCAANEAFLSTLNHKVIFWAIIEGCKVKLQANPTRFFTTLPPLTTLARAVPAKAKERLWLQTWPQLNAVP
jgi:hypothetical protein